MLWMLWDWAIKSMWASRLLNKVQWYVSVYTSGPSPGVWIPFRPHKRPVMNSKPPPSVKPNLNRSQEQSQTNKQTTGALSITRIYRNIWLLLIEITAEWSIAIAGGTEMFKQYKVHSWWEKHQTAKRVERFLHTHTTLCCYSMEGQSYCTSLSEFAVVLSCLNTHSSLPRV